MFNFLLSLFKPKKEENQFETAIALIDKINLNYFDTVFHHKNSMKVLSSIYDNVGEYNRFVLAAIGVLSDNKSLNANDYRKDPKEVYLSDFFLSKFTTVDSYKTDALVTLLSNMKNYLLIYEWKLNEEVKDINLNRKLMFLELLTGNIITIIYVLEEYSNS